ncbi:MAG: phenylalanine--tRNA ligase subunit beta [Candidatus Omnitrophica bacterium]|nr:phenylalanine--tRNA ligase subunit beta [Candidatus Omnitrophota bacterium]
MKITYNWIKEFVDLDISATELADKLTMAGIEVKAVEPRAGDFVYEIEITSNRPDWLSVLGIAREAAAVTGKKLKKSALAINAKKSKASAADSWKVNIEDRKDCFIYTAKLLTGLAVGPSPDWLKNRLELVGCRSVNNAVDITNYCLYELGEPLHAFDADALVQGSIGVRRAKPGEKIVTIDGQERKLDNNILVIADANKPVAVAGVMGGKDTEVTEKTKNVLLEAAIFHPVVVRRGRQALGLQTDASYRFERGIDPDMVEIASMRCVELMQRLCGASLRSANSSPAMKRAAKTVAFSAQDVNSILGVSLSADKISKILESLGFSVRKKAKSSFAVSVPGRRQDVNAPVDLVEEVARIYGFDRAPSSLAAVKLQSEGDDTYRRIAGIKTLLNSLGLDEVITYSMTDSASLAGYWEDEKALAAIANPLSEEQELLRPVLMPAVCRSVAYNLRQQQDYVGIFEIAKTYRLNNGRLAEEYHLCAAVCGSKPVWLEAQKKRLVDIPGFLHLKGIASGLFDRCGISAYSFNAVGPQLVEISIAGKPAGIMRKLSSQMLDRLEIKNKDVYAFEIALEPLLKGFGAARRYEPMSKYPGISRDISIVVTDDIQTAQLVEHIRQHGGELLEKVQISDFYKGKPIPEGRKNLTISCFYRSNSRTLQESEVAQKHGAVIEFLKVRFDAGIR